MIFKRPRTNPDPMPMAAEPTYIGRETSIEGNILSDGEIHIDGAVRGLVRAHTCLIDAHGELLGELFAQVIYVRGRMIGPIVGVNVHIEAGAHVEGNVTNETISIENGAYVLGSISHGDMSPLRNPTPQDSYINHEALPDEAVELEIKAPQKRD